MITHGIVHRKDISSFILSHSTWLATIIQYLIDTSKRSNIQKKTEERKKWETFEEKFKLLGWRMNGWRDTQTHINVTNFDCDYRCAFIRFQLVFHLFSFVFCKWKKAATEWMNEWMKKEKENQKTKRIFIFHDQRIRVEPISFVSYASVVSMVSCNSGCGIKIQRKKNVKDCVFMGHGRTTWMMQYWNAARRKNEWLHTKCGSIIAI